MISFLKQFWSQIKPPKSFSWQTLILLSLFSWLMSLLAQTQYLKDALAMMGWLFLTLGVGWALADVKIPVLGLTFRPGPWITGALTCVFLFDDLNDEVPSIAFISWPLISVAIAAIPKFIKRGPQFTLPAPKARQDLVILILFGVILSCWFRFHFLLQDWLRSYPSILADDFSRSAFVVNLSPESNSSRGVIILNLAESILVEQLGGEPLPVAERWLIDLDENIAELEADIKSRLTAPDENPLWSLRGRVPPNSPQYTLQLQAVWVGPSSEPGGYYLEKTCLISQVLNPERPRGSTTTVSQVTCESATPIQPFGPVESVRARR